MNLNLTDAGILEAATAIARSILSLGLLIVVAALLQALGRK